MPSTSLREPLSLPDAARGSDTARVFAAGVLLFLAVLLVFSRSLSFGFLRIDDNFFVYDEPHVTAGLTWEGLVWAFTAGPFGEWFPLSVLSHMLDCQLYGLHPAGHHLSSVLLHAATATTLFLALRRMSGEMAASLLVAALFALHPLRVESVTWIAERRDVLSGFFFALTLAAYAEYARRLRAPGWYLAVVGCFGLGLMSKATLVTVPPLLLLLDYWPLGRFDRAASATTSAKPARPPRWCLVLEKLPLLAIALLVALITRSTHAPWHLEQTLWQRIANAAVSYVAYLGQLFVPVGLSTYYVQPESGYPPWLVATAFLILAAITTLALISWRKRPYFFVGWFWYLGVLFPLIGLIPVGGEARSDRYTYLSQIGIYVALVWGVIKSTAARRPSDRKLVIGSTLILLGLAAITWRQEGVWQSDKALWEHAVACDSNNVRAHYMLAKTLNETDEAAAMVEFQKSLELPPESKNLYGRVRALTENYLAEMAFRKGRITDAAAHYRRALEYAPEFALAHAKLGSLLQNSGDLTDAAAHFQQRIDLEPKNPAGYVDMATLRIEEGRAEEAIALFRQALALAPNSPVEHFHVANLLSERGETDEAIGHLREAIKIAPQLYAPYFLLADLLEKQGKTREAAENQARGKKARRRYGEAQNDRGAELMKQGLLDEASQCFRQAIAANPHFAAAHCNLADALASQGDIDGAIAHYRLALASDPNFVPARRGLEQLSP